MSTLEILYKKIYWGLLATALTAVLLLFQTTGSISIISIIGIIAFALFTLYYSTILAKTLPGKISPIAFWAGFLLVAGGAIADMTITIIHTPDLSREGNLIIGMLLDFNFSLWVICCFTLTTQILQATLTLVLWLCFLKSYPTIVRAIPYKNLLTTCKWLFGGGKVNTINWLIGRKPDLFFLIPAFGFMLTMLDFCRWYFAMEWLKLVPISRVIAPSAIVLFAALGLISITHYKIKQNNRFI